MSKQDRLLHILNLLRSRKNLNARHLADECGVTERSIYRDIVSLSEANVPIYYDRGYKLASDLFLPPLNFDVDEYTCLRMALGSTPLRNTDKYRQVVRRIEAKVEAGLSSRVREQRRYRASPAEIDIAVTLSEERLCDFYADLERAVAETRTVTMTYESIESGVTERKVDPCFIVFKRHAFYFVGYCHLRKELRTFRLDRIRDLVVTEELFRPYLEVDARSYFEGSWEIYRGEPVEVCIRLRGASARVVEVGLHHPDEQITRLSDDEVEYRLTVSGTEEILRWVLGFGDEAEVIQPPSLRARVRQIAEGMLAVYRS